MSIKIAEPEYCLWSTKLFPNKDKNIVNGDYIAQLFASPDWAQMNVKTDNRVTLNYLVFSGSDNNSKQLKHGLSILSKIILFTKPVDIFCETKLRDLGITQYVSETLFSLNDPAEICEIVDRLIEVIIKWNSMSDSEAANINFVKMVNRHLVGNVIYLDHLADHIYDNTPMPLMIFGSYKSRTLRAYITRFDYKLFGTSYVLCQFGKKEDVIDILKFLEDNPMMPEFNSVYSQLILLCRIHDIQYKPSLMYNPEYRLSDNVFPDYSVYMYGVPDNTIVTGSFNDVC